MSNQEADVIILVGGKGTRLKSVVSEVPKPMAPVADRPFLEWFLLTLRTQGFGNVVLCTGYMGNAVRDYFEDGSRLGMHITYSHESRSLGTAGAVRKVLTDSVAERFIVMNGDSLCRSNLEELRREHESRKASVSMWVLPVQDCSRYGTVEIDSDLAVVAFQEKSLLHQYGLISAGIYLINRDVVERIPEEEYVSWENDIFPNMVGHGLYAVQGEGPFIDIGTPESYQKAELFEQGEISWIKI